MNVTVMWGKVMLVLEFVLFGVVTYFLGAHHERGRRGALDAALLVRVNMEMVDSTMAKVRSMVPRDCYDTRRPLRGCPTYSDSLIVQTDK